MTEIKSTSTDSFDSAEEIRQLAPEAATELADTLDMEVAAQGRQLTRYRNLLNQYLSGSWMYQPRPGEIDAFLATKLSLDVINTLSEQQKLERAVSMLESEIGEKKGRSQALRAEHNLGEGVTELSYDRTTDIATLKTIESKLIKLLDELSVARNEFYKGSAQAALDKIPDFAERTHIKRRDGMDDIEYLEFMLGVARLQLPELRATIELREQEESK